MKLTEFVLTEIVGSRPSEMEYFADVTVIEGLLFKKYSRRKIHREFATHWHFVDSGEYTPGYQAEELERAFRAQETLKNSHKYRLTI